MLLQYWRHVSTENLTLEINERPLFGVSWSRIHICNLVPLCKTFNYFYELQAIEMKVKEKKSLEIFHFRQCVLEFTWTWAVFTLYSKWQFWICFYPFVAVFLKSLGQLNFKSTTMFEGNLQLIGFSNYSINLATWTGSSVWPGFSRQCVTSSVLCLCFQCRSLAWDCFNLQSFCSFV